MAQLPLLSSGPLSAAVARLSATSVSAPSLASDPADFLASLLDARGGVHLADALYGLSVQDGLRAAAGGASPPPPAAMVAALRLRVDDETRALAARLDDAFRNAMKPRYRLPGPARALAVLDQAGALSRKPSRRLATTAARTLWAAYGDFLETHLKRARFGLRDLRVELAPRLRALGPAAERLEKLEVALHESTANAVEELYRRGMQRVEARFVEGLEGALQRIHKAGGIATESDLEMWFAAGGFVPAAFEEGRRFVSAVFQHERAHVEGLVRACTAL